MPVAEEINEGRNLLNCLLFSLLPEVEARAERLALEIPHLAAPSKSCFDLVILHAEIKRLRGELWSSGTKGCPEEERPDKQVIEELLAP